MRVKLDRQPSPFDAFFERGAAPPKRVMRLAEFIREGWHVLEPDTELVWGWHVDAIALHSEAQIRPEVRAKAFADGDSIRDLEWIQNLISNIPPGAMKSLIRCVFFPAWVWTFWPEWRSLFTSYSLDLARRDSLRTRDLILSDWYQATFAPDWRIRADKNTVSEFANTRGGIRRVASTGAQTTGFRGDHVESDDPLSVEQSFSIAFREKANRYLTKTLPSRLNRKLFGTRGLVMQRVHEDDPTGHILSRDRGRWVHLRLPMEFEPLDRCETPIWTDPRTEHGELLCPSLWPASAVASLKSDVELGPVAYAGQYQQRPSPEEGNRFQRRYWRYWCWPGQKVPPVVLRLADGTLLEIEAEELPPFEEMFQTWDMTFKATKGSDFVAGGTFGRARSAVYLVDIVNARMGYVASKEAVRAMKARWPQTGAIYVEDKANGPAVIDDLRADIPGLIPVAPEVYGDKVSRSHAVQPFLMAGNVYLPHPMIHGLTNALVDQAAQFPNGTHDDMVDMLTWGVRLSLVGRTFEVEDRVLTPVTLPSEIAEIYAYEVE